MLCLQIISIAPADLVQRRCSNSPWQCQDKPGFLVCLLWRRVCGRRGSKLRRWSRFASLCRSSGSSALHGNSTRTVNDLSNTWFLLDGPNPHYHKLISDIQFHYGMKMCPGRGSIVKRMSNGWKRWAAHTGTKPPLCWVQYAGSSRVLDVKNTLLRHSLE